MSQATKTATTFVISFVRTFFNIFQRFSDKLSLTAQKMFWQSESEKLTKAIKDDAKGIDALCVRIETALISAFAYMDGEQITATGEGNASHIAVQMTAKIAVIDSTLALVRGIASGSLHAAYSKFLDSKNAKTAKTALETYLAASNGAKVGIKGESENAKLLTDVSYTAYDKAGKIEAFITASLQSVLLAEEGKFAEASNLLYDALSELELQSLVANDEKYFVMAIERGFAASRTKAHLRSAEEAIKIAKTNAKDSYADYLRVWFDENALLELIAECYSELKRGNDANYSSAITKIKTASSGEAFADNVTLKILAQESAQKGFSEAKARIVTLESELQTATTKQGKLDSDLIKAKNDKAKQAVQARIVANDARINEIKAELDNLNVTAATLES